MRPSLLIFLVVFGWWSWHAFARQHAAEAEAEADRLRAHNEILVHELYALDEVDPLTGKERVRHVIERAIAIEGVNWGEHEVEAMLRLCWRESKYNPKLDNPRSTAYGLWQFLDSTWGYYGIQKTDDPLLQTIAAVRYIEDRYGTPRKALEFHLVAREVNGVVQHYY